MDVIGNNISNVNTTGYKTSEVTFKDVYYQTKANASSGDATSGGKNPTQIGYGAQLGTVSQVMVQSGFTYTDSVFNCALQGDGFFQVMDGSGNIYYTRAGKFSIDSYGNLCDPNGNVVLGVSGDPTGITTGQSQRINIKVPAIDNNNASATKLVNGYEITITANTYGEQGNISFTIVDSDTPYATKTGDNMTIYMDLSQDFGSEALAKLMAIAEADRKQSDYKEYIDSALQDFKDALNDAIKRGGTDIDGDLLDLNIEFDTDPPYEDICALKAKNTATLSYDVKNDDGKLTDKYSAKFTFEAMEAGEEANQYEIDLKTSASSDTVSAKWKDGVLVLTIPATGESLDPDGNAYADLQTAINAAITNLQPPVECTISNVTHITYDPATGVESGRDESGVVGTADAFDFLRAIGVGKTERLGLGGTDTGDPDTAVRGRNNFFSDMAKGLSTVTLADGRTAKEQAVDDLEVIQIDTDGTIYGRHAVHGLLLLGRIDIATFENPTGLEQCGTSLWRASLASGEAQVKIGGKDGAGEVIQGALEMSNVDLAQEFSDMIITQRGYQANSRVITVSDTMLEELVNLKR
jgi:flagellar hook protein FlgE